jgi:hypothetical protein
MDREYIEIWQSYRYEEIIFSKNKDWDLIMPKRTGKTTLIRKLAVYYIGKGYDVYILCQYSDKEYADIDYKKIDGQKFEPHKFEKDKTVILIDGIIKWDPHHEIIPIGGMIVTAYTPYDDSYRQNGREYRKLE